MNSALLPSPSDLQTMLTLAKEFLASGLLPPTIKSESAALLIIQKGRELGIPPTYALTNIVVISGKPVCSAELMLALVKRDHGRDAMHIVETTEDRCVIRYKDGSYTGEFAFTMEDAKRAGLTANQTWQKYPKAMLRARAISAVARMAFPDSIGGMYTPEELGAEVDVDADGDIRIVSLPAEETPLIPAPRQLRVAEGLRNRFTAYATKVAQDRGQMGFLASDRERNEVLAMFHEHGLAEPEINFVVEYFVGPGASLATMTKAQAAAFKKMIADSAFPAATQEILGDAWTPRSVSPTSADSSSAERSSI